MFVKVVFRMLFHGFDHLLLWLLVMFSLHVLHLAIYDLGVKEGSGFPENSDVSARASHRESSRKILIVFVEGLRPANFLKSIQQSRVLSRIVATDGVWGHVSWDPPGPGSTGFEPFFTGNPEGYGPGVLSMADSLIFFGQEKLAHGLKIPSNYSGRFDVYDPESTDFENMGWGEFNRDMKAISLLTEQTHRRDIWLNKKEVVILHLTALGIAIRREGELSVKAQGSLHQTMNQLDIVLNEIERTLYNDKLTIFVTSVGSFVPMVAWGYGIAKPTYEDLRFYRETSHQIPTSPKDLDVTSMAPLLACILGGPPPPNSIGTLPEQYLEMDRDEVGVCQLETANEIVKLYAKQAHEITNGRLTRMSSMSADLISIEEAEDMKKQISFALAAGDYKNAATQYSTLTSSCIEGIHHYATFGSHFLSHLILFVLIGSLLCSATLLMKAVPSLPREGHRANGDQPADLWRLPSLKLVPSVDAIFIVILLLFLVMVGMDNFPRRFLYYISVGIVPWWCACRNFRNWMDSCKIQGQRRINTGGKGLELVYIALSIVSGVVAAFGYSMMIIYLVSMVFLCFTSLAGTSDTKISVWLFTTLPLVSSLIHVYGPQSYGFVKSLAALTWIVLSWLTAWGAQVQLVECSIIALNTIPALFVMFTRSDGLFYQISWAVILLIPFLGSQNLLIRFVQIFMSMGIPYLFLSTGGEPISFIIFVAHLTTWMIAESYHDLKELVTQSVAIEGRPNGRRFSVNDLKMNYFFNIYCMLSLMLVYPNGLKDDCTIFTPTDSLISRLFHCEIKQSVPILAVSVLFSHMTRKTGCQHYYSLLASYLYFTYMIFCTFIRHFRVGWSDPLPSIHELALVHSPVSLWASVLVCSWIADLLLCPSLLRKRTTTHQLP